MKKKRIIRKLLIVLIVIILIVVCNIIVHQTKDPYDYCSNCIVYAGIKDGPLDEDGIVLTKHTDIKKYSKLKDYTSDKFSYVVTHHIQYTSIDTYKVEENIVTVYLKENTKKGTKEDTNLLRIFNPKYKIYYVYYELDDTVLAQSNIKAPNLKDNNDNPNIKENGGSE